jgi:hypothetical protein
MRTNATLWHVHETNLEEYPFQEWPLDIAGIYKNLFHTTEKLIIWNNDIHNLKFHYNS